MYTFRGTIFQTSMIPYLHLGPINLPTFGLMVATGLLVASYILQADFRRRGIHADAFLIIGIAGLAGILGARLYHVLESPSEFFANPWPQIVSRFGFAWFGGFLGGFAALLILGRREKIPTLTFLDACSPAACVGYAIGRIGCLLSGDGDYGIPTNLPWGMSFPSGVVPTTETCVQQGWHADCRVHPTPLYEIFRLDVDCLRALANRRLPTARKKIRRHGLLRLSGFHRYRAVSRRNYSHQSAIVLRHVQRPSRQRSIRIARCCAFVCSLQKSRRDPDGHSQITLARKSSRHSEPSDWRFPPCRKESLFDCAQPRTIFRQ